MAHGNVKLAGTSIDFHRLGALLEKSKAGHTRAAEEKELVEILTKARKFSERNVSVLKASTFPTVTA